MRDMIRTTDPYICTSLLSTTTNDRRVQLRTNGFNLWSQYEPLSRHFGEQISPTVCTTSCRYSSHNNNHHMNARTHNKKMKCGRRFLRLHQFLKNFFPLTQYTTESMFFLRNLRIIRSGGVMILWILLILFSQQHSPSIPGIYGFTTTTFPPIMNTFVYSNQQRRQYKASLLPHSHPRRQQSTTTLLLPLNLQSNNYNFCGSTLSLSKTSRRYPKHMFVSLFPTQRFISITTLQRQRQRRRRRRRQSTLSPLLVISSSSSEELDSQSSSLSGSNPSEESPSSLLSSEYIYAQRLQQQIDALRQKDRSSQPIAIPDLQIIYEDTDIIVVDKPAGILCLPSEDGVPSIVETVFEYIQQQQHQQCNATLVSDKAATTTDDTATNDTTATPIMEEADTISSGIIERVSSMEQMIVHRLGYDTAGLLLLAKTIPAVRALNILFRTRPSLSSSSTPNLPCTLQDERNISDTTTTTVEINDAPNDLVTEKNQDETIVDIGITERLNQMGIIRQYEVLVAGHVHPQYPVVTNTATATTITTTTETSTNTTTPTITSHTEETIQSSSSSSTPLGSGWIHLPLMRCYEYPPYMRVSTPEQQQYLLTLDSSIVGKKLLEAPKASLTYYEIMNYEYYQNNPTLPVTRMTLTSMTGRTHQLNVHCAAIGHPIVRDTVYGYNGSAAPYGGLSIDQLPTDSAGMELQRAIHEATLNNNENNNVTKATTSKMCVHAKVIRFKHPITGVDLKFNSTPSF